MQRDHNSKSADMMTTEWEKKLMWEIEIKTIKSIVDELLWHFTSGIFARAPFIIFIPFWAFEFSKKKARVFFILACYFLPVIFHFASILCLVVSKKTWSRVRFIFFNRTRATQTKERKQQNRHWEIIFESYMKKKSTLRETLLTWFMGKTAMLHN